MSLPLYLKEPKKKKRSIVKSSLEIPTSMEKKII